MKDYHKNDGRMWMFRGVIGKVFFGAIIIMIVFSVIAKIFDWKL